MRKYCRKCEKYDNFLIFFSSEDGNTRIPSLDQTTCEECKTNCKRCEYVTYDPILMEEDNWRYPTRN